MSRKNGPLGTFEKGGHWHCNWCGQPLHEEGGIPPNIEQLKHRLRGRMVTMSENGTPLIKPFPDPEAQEIIAAIEFLENRLRTMLEGKIAARAVEKG